MTRNRMKGVDQQQYKPEPLRPIFEAGQLEQGVWMQLIPNKLRMIVTDHGVGPTPKKGQFIRLKQFIYLQDLTNLRQERLTYTFNRNKLIPGLEYCLAVSRQCFKARIYIDSEYAYGQKSFPGVPPNSNLVFDIQINAITPQPLNNSRQDDQQLLGQIIAKAKDGDQYLRKGQYKEAQRILQSSFWLIQSTRCKQIKNHLYSNNKINFLISNQDRTSQQIEKEKQQLVQIYKTFDIIKIKTAQVALINKDYYKVITLTKNCLMESRLQQNCRVLAARARAFIQIGQFQLGINILQHLTDQNNDQQTYRKQLERALQKREKVLKLAPKQLKGQPVLPITTKLKKRKKVKKQLLQVPRYQFESDNMDYQADQQIQKPSQPFFSGIGMHFGYQDLDNF